MMKIRNPIAVLFWSFGIFIVINLVQYAGVFVASLLSGAGFVEIIEGNFNSPFTVLGRGLVYAIVGIPWTILTVRYLWRRNWGWMRFRFNHKLLFIGFLVGLLLPLMLLLIVGLLGTVNYRGTAAGLSATEIFWILIGSIGWTIFIAMSEELVFRGMAVREWAAKFGWILASLLGGIYFGAAHIIGLLPNLNVIDIIWIMTAAMVGNALFVAFYIRGKSLWLPIGFHAGWNLCLKTILGITLSGMPSELSILKIEISGRGIITGGKFGLEASVVTMIIYLIVTVLLLYYSKSGKPELLGSGLE